MERRKQAYKIIKELVKRFGEHVDEYKRGSYSETQTRVDFIDPFFIALIWDHAGLDLQSELFVFK